MRAPLWAYTVRIDGALRVGEIRATDVREARRKIKRALARLGRHIVVSMVISAPARLERVAS